MTFWMDEVGGNVMCDAKHCTLTSFAIAEANLLTVGFSNDIAPRTSSGDCWSVTATGMLNVCTPSRRRAIVQRSIACSTTSSTFITKFIRGVHFRTTPAWD